MELINRRPYLFLDLGFYAACNLKCTYCREGIVKDDKKFSFDSLVEQIDLFQKKFEAGVVKLSGYGEISLWRHFGDSLALLSPRFPTVQVISNGTFNERTREKFFDYPNIIPNITVDGHDIQMNKLRVMGNETHHRKMLDNIAEFVNRGRPIEINCVLHEHNIDELESFAAYLSEVDNGREMIMLFPFPVKPFDRAPSAADPLRQKLSRAAENIPKIWEKYPAILPHSAYGQQLQSMLFHGERKGKCHVHYANLGTGSRNERLHCANYGESLSYGPMNAGLTTEIEAIAAKEKKHLKWGGVGPDCTRCFNHFHIINLYLEGTIPLSALQRMPTLREPGSLKVAAQLKTLFEHEHAMVSESV